MHTEVRCDKNNRGFNLVEAAIVLGVIGLVIGGIWVAAASVTENRKLARTVEQILYISNSISRLFPANVPFTIGNTTFGQIQFMDTDCGGGCMPKSGWTGIIPEDMVTNATTPIDLWGRNVEVQPQAGGRTYIGFYINRRNHCIQLAPRIAAAASGTLISIDWFSGTALQVNTPELAAANCTSSGYLRMFFRR